MVQLNAARAGRNGMHIGYMNLSAISCAVWNLAGV